LTAALPHRYTHATPSKEAAMRLLVPLLLALPVWAAPAPFLPRKLTPAETEFKALQGEWIGQTYIRDGMPTKLLGDSSNVFVGDVSTVRNSGLLCSRWRFTLDTSKTPAVMNLVGEAPTSFVGNIIRCRYRLDGDTLTICWNNKDESLPPGIEPGGGVTVKVYKRKRP
jgi:uncharacterized protein (TIGR03067 family)